MPSYRGISTTTNSPYITLSCLRSQTTILGGRSGCIANRREPQSVLSDEATRLADLGAFWREVILSAVGYLVHHQREYEKPRYLVQTLCPEQSTSDAARWRKV